MAKHNAVIPEPVSYNVSLLSRISRGREMYTTLRFPPFYYSETYKPERVRRITYCVNFTDSSRIYQVLRKKTKCKRTILFFSSFLRERKNKKKGKNAHAHTHSRTHGHKKKE